MKLTRLILCLLLICAVPVFSDGTDSAQNVNYGTGAGENLETDATGLRGAGNTAIGFDALYADTTGSANTALGYGALRSLTSGIGNIGIGYLAADTCTATSHFLHIGNAFYRQYGIYGLINLGRFGINTATPTRAFDVNGSLGADSLIITDISAEDIVASDSLITNTVAVDTIDTQDNTTLRILATTVVEDTLSSNTVLADTVDIQGNLSLRILNTTIVEDTLSSNTVLVDTLDAQGDVSIVVMDDITVKDTLFVNTVAVDSVDAENGLAVYFLDDVDVADSLFANTAVIDSINAEDGLAVYILDDLDVADSLFVNTIAVDTLDTEDDVSIVVMDDITVNDTLFVNTVAVDSINAEDGLAVYFLDDVVVNDSLFAGTVTATSIATPTAGVAFSIPDSLNVSGTISGETVSDQASYLLASQLFRTDTSISALYTWMTPSDAGTEQDLSPHNLDLTYVDGSNFSAADKIQKGSVWALDFDATDDYLTAADAAAWSFNGTADAAFSIGGWIQVVAHTDTQGIWDKYTASGTPQREWAIYLDATEKLNFILFDEADDKESSNITTDTVAAGWHFIVHTYDGTGGATALDEANALWYVDGVSVADTDTDNGDYTNMVDGTSLVHIGSIDYGVVGDNPFQGDMGIMFIANTELSADNIWLMYLATRGFYNE